MGRLFSKCWSTSTVAAAPSNGLLTDLIYAHPFDDDALDGSGNDLHLTAVNTPTYVAGKTGSKAAAFDEPSDQHFSRAHSALLFPTGNHVTWSCWFRPKGDGSGWNYVHRHPSHIQIYCLGAPGSEYLQVAIWHSAGALTLNLTGGVFTHEAWNHVAIVIRADLIVRVFINGVEINSTALGGNVKTAGLYSNYWGAASATATMDGDIDQPAMWDRG